MSVKITYFVHGTTKDNEQDLSTGWASGDLSELGIRQAVELGKLVAGRRFDVIFCSDLKRAIESAQLGFGDKYEIISDPRLRECNYGDFTQKPSEFKSDMNEWIERPFPNGESYKDMEGRVREFLDSLKENYKGKHVGIVAHEAPQLALEVLTRKKSWREAIAENWRNTKSW